MAFAPPPYQAASYRRLWTVVAPYIPLSDLYSACLVSRQFHQIFSPHLWGDPGSRFGWDNDTIYLSLTRFKRLLTKVRYDVRRLAHTLSIPPAQPEFYGGPQAGWLRDILDRLPCLQALVVSNLSFFDHQCLQPCQINHRAPPRSPAKYPLKLLIASECENTTAISLATALVQFPDLIYLDLSTTQGARSPYVLRQIGCLLDLKFLKLRNCSLRDEDLDYLALHQKLISLDVSHNFLTERGISRLLELIPAESLSNGRDHLSLQNVSPIDRRYSGIPLKTRVLAEGLEKFIFRSVTGSVDGYSQVEEGIPSTFTDFRLASNYITVDGINKIIRDHKVQNMDLGTLNLY
jgi:hypothetical protein